jgi:hypothetical protein
MDEKKNMGVENVLETPRAEHALISSVQVALRFGRVASLRCLGEIVPD